MFDCFVTARKGAEPLLVAELRTLGLAGVRHSTGTVAIRGELTSAA